MSPDKKPPQIHLLDGFALDSGEVLDGAALAYVTYGKLNSAGDNTVILPSYFSGTHNSYAPWIGGGHVLDPAHYFIVLTNMFGNGQSSSPSNHPLGGCFPGITIADNVRAQHDLLTRQFGISQIALAAGWSLGAMQSLHWAMLYPDMVKRVMAVCGTAYCWPLNTVFLEGLAPLLEAGSLLEADALRMFGRAYAGWAYSAQFFRDELYRELGFNDIESLLLWWEQDHLTQRGSDLLAVLNTWRAMARPDAPLMSASLARITGNGLIMPCDTDVYFNLEEAKLEAALIEKARFVPLDSPFGHCAGAPGRFAKETKFIEENMRQLLAMPV